MKRIVLNISILLLNVSVYAQWQDNGANSTTTDDIGIGGIPAFKLDVGNFQNGSISNEVVLRLRNTVAQNQSSNWGSAIEFYNMSNNITNSTLEGAKIISEASQYGWSHNLKFRVFQNNSFQNQIGTDAMTITTDGKIGIGITNPYRLLHLHSSSGNQLIQFTSDATGLGSVQGTSLGVASGNDFQIWNWENGYFRIGTSGTERFRVDSNGNVGIGGVAASNLDVGNFQNGSVSNEVVLRLRNTVAQNQASNWGSAIEFYNMSNNITSNSLEGAKIISEASQYGWSHNLKFRVFQNNNFQNQIGIDAMTIRTNGNVGIGTTNPDSKLAVDGTIHTKEVKVDLTGWSDFVFESDYELLALEEVEQHIAEKGHLPEIPSEAEVIENGINLGEMDAKLLQKIEELTLYLIEQNKEIKELKEKVQSLENE